MKLKVFSFTRSKIVRKYVLLFFFIGVVPLVILSACFYWLLDTSFAKEISYNRQKIIDAYAQNIELHIQKPKSILHSFSSLAALLFSSPERMKLLLIKLTLDVPNIQSATYYDVEGTVEISSSNRPQSLDNNKKEYIYDVVNKRQTYVSEVYVDKDYIPYIDIAVPVVRLNAVKGYMLAKIDISSMWDIVDSIRYGKTGRAFMITNEGQIIAHWDKKRILVGDSIKKDELLSHVFDEHKGFFRFYDEKSQFQKVVYFTHLREMNWILCVTQAVKEVYYYFYLSVVYTVIVLGLIIIVIIYGSYRMAKRITRPLIDMSYATKRIAESDYDIHFNAKSDDEIGILALAIEQMAKKLKEAEENKHLAMFGAAAASIAHKMKNAMVAIKTCVQLIARKRNDQKAMNRIEKELNEEVSRVENILSRFSHFGENRVVHPELYRFDEIVDSVVRRLKPLCEQYGVAIFSDVIKERVKVAIHSEDMREILVNIMQNAVEAMPDGGELRINISLEEINTEKAKEAKVIIKVSDTGCGLSKQHIKQVGKPFFTTKPRGMGIGLTYCKKLITDLKGGFLIESVEEKGTTITIQLPVLNAH